MEVEVLEFPGSLTLQIVLILFAWCSVARLWIRMTLWTAYLLADWIATVALGVICQNTLDECQQGSVDGNLKDELMSFWAPFLLLHSMNPDTITAYSLEDNELLFWASNSKLNHIRICFIKFCERTCALRLANTENLRNSMLTPPDPGPNYAKFMEEFTLKKAEGFYVMADEVKEIPVPIDHSYDTGKDKLLLISEAYDQFQTLNFICGSHPQFPGPRQQPMLLPETYFNRSFTS
ncbi:hypothetical protein HAX54_035827 [Datura stramonium]|uniref:DUF4220 domain-containing protein n=1 Tax=Datura stramonium TaxID=4076 RepID=A0ABS8RNS0_DATST|nr:hypothetical protein [Datura stramonium]